TRPPRGSYVTTIALSQVQNGCFVRQASECAVVRRAAAMITDNQCYQLAQNLHLQHIASARKQIAAFVQLDDDVRRRLALR
ncbi:GntR family transcriptional regulator, partial [Salmonella enterica subsp. enterica serovar Poona]